MSLTKRQRDDRNAVMVILVILCLMAGLAALAFAIVITGAAYLMAMLVPWWAIVGIFAFLCAFPAAYMFFAQRV